MNLSKICSSCRTDKPLDDYHNDRTKNDGKTSSCKSCATLRVLKWAEDNMEKVSKNKRAYYDRNTSKVKESAKVWRIENPEANKKSVEKYQTKNRQKLNDRAKTHYQNNRERLLQYHNEYRNKNRELCKVRVRNSQKKNPLRLRINKYKRRIREGDGRVTVKRINALLVIQEGNCVYCRIELVKFHVDHIVPLAKGGTNTDDNIQLLCPTCNRKKGSKYPYAHK